MLKVRVPSEESLSEIEASSRLILDHGTLYLSTPAVRLNQDNEAEITPVGFVIGPHVLVTVRFASCRSSTRPASASVPNDSLENGMCVFTSLLEAMIDRVPMLSSTSARRSTSFRAASSRRSHRTKRPVRSSRRMREALENVGELADRLAKARDVLLGEGVSLPMPIMSGANGSQRRRRSVSRRSRRMSSRSVIYETRLSDKIQLLLDAVLGFINIQQNEMFQGPHDRLRGRRAAHDPGRRLGHELQEHAGAELDVRLSAVAARDHRERRAAADLVQAAWLVRVNRRGECCATPRLLPILPALSDCGNAEKPITPRHFYLMICRYLHQRFLIGPFRYKLFGVANDTLFGGNLHAGARLISRVHCCRNDCIGRARRPRLQHDRLWCRRGRRKPQGRDHPEAPSGIDALKAQYRRPASSRSEGHPYTPEKAALGKKLYFDTRLSVTSAQSCASCHSPGFGWGDGLAVGVGHGMAKLGRHSPTIVNAAWSAIFMWDGRLPTLEDQALGPIQSPGEMNMKLDDLMVRLTSIPEYKPMFETSFPGRASRPRRWRRRSPPMSAQWSRSVRRSTPGSKVTKRPFRRSQARVRRVQRQGTMRCLPRGLEFHQ